MPECLSRRQLLTAAGAAALGGGITGATGVAQAEHAPPEYVSLSYPEQLIKRHQPLLVMDGVEQQPTGYHAMLVESAEAEFDVIVGFNKYLYQEGIDPTGSDSHLGDREPVYIYLDESGSPVKIQYSAYHWYENTEYWSDLQTDESGDRPLLQVVPRWHHHVTYSGSRSGQTVPVRDLRDSYPTWLQNGLEDEIHPGAVYHPQQEMQQRAYWWADGAQNWSERLLASVYLSLGVRGASQTDLEGGVW